MKTSNPRPKILSRIIAPTFLATALALVPMSSDGQSCCGGSSGGGGTSSSYGAGARVLQLRLKAPTAPKRLLVADVTNRKVLYNKLIQHGQGQTEISVRLKVPRDVIIKTRYIEPALLTTGPGSALPASLAYLMTSAGTMARSTSDTSPSTDSEVPEGTQCDTETSGSTSESEPCPGPTCYTSDDESPETLTDYPYDYPYDSGSGETQQPMEDIDDGGGDGEFVGPTDGEEPGDGQTSDNETEEYDPMADNDLSDEVLDDPAEEGEIVSADGTDEGHVTLPPQHGGVNVTMSLGKLRRKSFGNVSLRLSNIVPNPPSHVIGSFDWHQLKGSYWGMGAWPSNEVYHNGTGMIYPVSNPGYEKFIPTASGIAGVRNLPASEDYQVGYQVDFFKNVLSGANVTKGPSATWLFVSPDTTTGASGTIPNSVTEGGIVRTPKLRVMHGKFMGTTPIAQVDVTDYHLESVGSVWVMSRSRVTKAIGGVSEDGTIAPNIDLFSPAGNTDIETGTYEVVKKWTVSTGGRQTRYTYTSTKANAVWKHKIDVLSVGPEANAVSPATLESEVLATYGATVQTSVRVIGNITRGHWTWTKKGWEGRLVRGSVAAPTYETTILRPYGNQISPIGVNVNNCDSTITQHTELAGYSASIVERKVMGQTVSYTVNSKTGGRYSDVYTSARATGTGNWECRVRTVVASGWPLAGRPISEILPDGTYVTYSYSYGVWNPTTRIFSTTLPAEISLTPEQGAMMVEQYNYGAGDRRVSIYDEQRRLVREETRKDNQMIYANVYDYDSEGNLLFKYREDGAAIGGLRVVYAATYGPRPDGTGSKKESETDETGVVTTFDDDRKPTLVTRLGLAATASLPAIPELQTVYTYDTEGRRDSETKKSGATTLGARSWKYDAEGRLKLESVNGLVTQYAYEILPDGRQVERRYGPGGAAQNESANLATLVPSATTTYLADGRLESVTGTGVVAERYNYSYDSSGFLVTEVVSGSGTSAAPDAETVISRTRSDWAGRRVAEQIQTPIALGQHFRTWEYDGAGRVANEKVDATVRKSYSYPSFGVANVVVNAQPDPERTSSRTQAMVFEGGAWWQKTSGDAGSSRRKLSGLTNGVISYSESTDAAGRKSTTTETLLAGSTVLVSHTLDGVSNPAHAYRRAGFTVKESTFSVQQPTTTTVDAVGRPLYILNTGMQIATNFTYDPLTQQIETVTTAPLAGGPTQTEVRTYFGAASVNTGEYPYRLQSQVKNGQSATPHYTFYTPRGEIAGEWGNSYPVRYTYDAVGRMKKMETYQTHPGSTFSLWPAGNPTTWVYYPGTDLLQTKRDSGVPGITAPAGPTYTYDVEGRVALRTWVRGVETRYYYNNAGELRVIDYSDATPDVTVTRTNKGRLATIQDGTGFKAYGYGTGGALESETQYDMSWNELASLNYVHDQHGRRAGYGYWDNVSGTWVTWQSWWHEPETGRVDGINTTWGGFDYVYKPGSDWLWKTVYSGETMVTTRTPDALWRLSSIVTTGRSPITGEQVLVSPLASHTYAYNAKHERWKATQGDGSYWQYNYDDLGQVTGGDKHVPDSTAYPGYDFDYEYDAIGNRTKMWTNGRRRDYTRNELNQYTLQREKNSDGSATTTPNKIDIVGLAGPTATGVNVNGVSATMKALASGTQAFHGLADTGVAGTGRAAYRTVTVEELNPPAAPTGTTGTVYVPPAYVTPGRISYDPDGNLISDDRFVYIWDAENRLVEVRTRAWHFNSNTGLATPANQPFERTLHTYDAFWRLVKSQVQEKPSATGAVVNKAADLFAYDGWNIIAEWSAEGPDRRIVRTNHWGLDLSGTWQGAGGVGGLLQSIAGTGFAPTSARTVEHPFYDGNGNIMGTYNVAGWGPLPSQVLAENEYDPFGRRIRTTGPSPTLPYRFSTKREDARTGLNYYGYRWYQASTGRWVGRDPIGERGGINLYGMVGNQTISKIDILGLATTTTTTTVYRRKWVYNSEKGKPEYVKPPWDPDPSMGSVSTEWDIEDCATGGDIKRGQTKIKDEVSTTVLTLLEVMNPLSWVKGLLGKFEDIVDAQIVETKQEASVSISKTEYVQCGDFIGPLPDGKVMVKKRVHFNASITVKAKWLKFSLLGNEISKEEEITYSGDPSYVDGPCCCRSKSGIVP